MTTPPLAPDSDTERLLAEADRYADESETYAEVLLQKMAAKVRELQAERDDKASQAALYHKDAMIVREQRDAARDELARVREIVNEAMEHLSSDSQVFGILLPALATTPPTRSAP